MSHQPLLTSGQEYVDQHAALIEQLSDELRGLKQQLLAKDGEIAALKRANAKAVGALRQQLTPLYRALQSVFGELEAVGGEDSPVASGSSKWEAIKQRLSPRLREAVDIFLSQGSMRRVQIASALKMDYTNCRKNVVGELLKQGLLVDNGGELSLKEL